MMLVGLASSVSVAVVGGVIGVAGAGFCAPADGTKASASARPPMPYFRFMISPKVVQSVQHLERCRVAFGRRAPKWSEANNEASRADPWRSLTTSSLMATTPRIDCALDGGLRECHQK